MNRETVSAAGLDTLPVSRRSWLQKAAFVGGMSAVAAVAARGDEEEYRPQGRIHHSIVRWCFNDHFSIRQLCQVARQLGCESVELADPRDWPILRQMQLKCAIASSHSFVQGMNNPRYHAGCAEVLRATIDRCAEGGVPTAITFTGFAEESGEWAGGKAPQFDTLPPHRRVIDPDEGIRNCVAGFKKVVGYAEEKNINLSLEMLNSRVADHPMKGHPGYQGDHVDYCLEIIRQVGSPRLGLLFDIYHVQIMDGDLIRRIQAAKEFINHVHTAGNPGRGELDEAQEIHYPAVMKALVETGYQGFVGHEFIPTRDPIAGLRQAVRICDA